MSCVISQPLTGLAVPSNRPESRSAESRSAESRSAESLMKEEEHEDLLLLLSRPGGGPEGPDLEEDRRVQTWRRTWRRTRGSRPGGGSRPDLEEDQRVQTWRRVQTRPGGGPEEGLMKTL